ncbi:hypothetical protein [Brucella anthropi]|uniref:hypothetical protein n=1 Tax=Brucella anthropi TaxID=529 RepID=UPI0021669371|nr:hypothetical protein [Brucella anthropi]UVV67097.1 hypothetical protein NW321_11560 [Brucella anthropi]
MQNLINELENAAATLPMSPQTQAAAIRQLAAQQAEQQRLIDALEEAIERIEQALIHFNNQ